MNYDYAKNSFRCTTTKAGYLIITIPYDKHWKAYIDGIRVDVQKFNAFISLDINEGKHEITLIY
ncbi:YfhO family protein [Butyrivibrio fibrisolvens]|uniref:YfhO family protein n=1 Tax=Butyrivibrio fibrisolvens TaxID=831 RepID=UPI003B505C16